VKYLLEKGADPNIKYTYVLESRTISTAINMGIDAAEYTYSEETVIELAKRKGYVDIVELLNQFKTKN
jgi:hypothetical protein